MANEVNIATSFRFSNGSAAEIRRGASFLASPSSLRFNHAYHNVGITEEAMKLSEVGTPTRVWIKNHDATNFVQILSATSGTAILKVGPGEEYVFRFGSGVTAPYVIADTAACNVEYMISDA